MKIFFVASPRLVSKEPALFQMIHSHLAKNNIMLSDKLLKWTDKKTVEKIYDISQQESAQAYQKSIEMVKKADVVMMEVSGHSVSMGYLISKSLDLCKPVIAFYKKGTKILFLRGISNPKFKLVEYDKKNIGTLLDQGLEEAKKEIDVRFNFFVSPKILAYLDWIAQKRMIPRSVFLRNLIEKEIKKEKEFRG
ncbi:MAG: hypothetical protein PHR98_00590 [Candidatus Shapirobacteria bacterium]|nr:hypothetical protein [Candidatus Shapirobacteria bacterium]